MIPVRPTRLLAPLVPAYAAAVALKNAAYARGWLVPRHLEVPVISVGGLSVGGSGKTPLVICLARLLASHGVHVDVLSRGYGRRSAVTERVELGHVEGGAARYGDEPLLIAHATSVPVYVGSHRHSAGLLAEQQSPGPGPRIHLLDDGFQHRQLARAANIVVLHRSDFHEQLLPAGRLREPFASLRRATVAVLRAEDAEGGENAEKARENAELKPGKATELETELRLRGLDLPVWLVSRSLVVSPLALAAPALAFCGIARPQEFFSALRAAGVALTATQTYPDHHFFLDADIAALTATARAAHARVLLTTEKDLVRLSPRAREALQQAAPLQSVPLDLRLHDEESALSTLLRSAGLFALPDRPPSQPA